MHPAQILQQFASNPVHWIEAVNTLLPFGGYCNNIPFEGLVAAAGGETFAPVYEHVVLWLAANDLAILLDTSNRSSSPHGRAIPGMGAILDYLLSNVRSHTTISSYTHALMSMMLHIASCTMIETNAMYVEAVSSALDHFTHIIPEDQRMSAMPALFCQQSSKFAYIPLDQNVVIATIRKFSITLSMQNMGDDSDPTYVAEVTGVINH